MSKEPLPSEEGLESDESGMSHDENPTGESLTSEDSGLIEEVFIEKPPSGFGPNSYFFALIFYFVLVGIAVFVGQIWEVDPIRPFFESSIPLWGDVIIGAVIGLIITGISRVLELLIPAFRRLGNIFSEMLGPIGISGALFLAIVSSIGEEIFFRGFIQQILDTVTFAGVVDGDWYAIIITSIIFGLVHQGPKPKVFLPWTIFALVVGFLLGILYVVTGNLIAPIVMHFTINFLNLSALSKRYSKQATNIN